MDIFTLQCNRKRGNNMSTKTPLQVRVDTDTKREAAQVFDSLGLSLSDAINVFLKKAIVYNGFPFEVRNEILNNETVSAIVDVENNKGMSKAFSSVEDLMEDLNA